MSVPAPDSPAKLPFGLCLQWAVQWTVAIVARHQLVVALYAVAGVLLGLVAMNAPLLTGLGWIVLGIASIGLALLTHHEVLRGPSQMDAEVVGRSGGRIFSYFLDCLVLVIIMGVVTFLPTFLATAVLMVDVGDIVGILSIIVMVASVIAGLVVTSRMALRLPSRALGETMRWGDVWRMGAGHSVVLVVVPLLLALPFSIISGVCAGLVSEGFADMVNWALLPLQVIVSCAFLSVAYGRLRALSGPC